MILRIRQSLIGSWYAAMSDDSGAREDEFLDALSGYMWGGNRWTRLGNEFEDAVTGVVKNTAEPPRNWYRDMAIAVAQEIKGAALQVRIRKLCEVDGTTFLLDGTLDALRAGQIYDIKYSEAYPRRYPVRLNYYFDSPQTSMYFKLVPEATRFTYLITDGTYLYREWYHPDEVMPIETRIRAFMEYLEASGNLNTYIKNWRVDNK